MSEASDRLVAQLTRDEKVALLSGADVWRTAAIERLGIPATKTTDGPNGARGDSTTGARAVCLPASISIAASFDAELVTEVGRLLGRETVRKGAQILLAPTINMARHPLGGRNFESFGEDPMLTSVMAVAYIAGVQDEGVGACAKHFVANDVEYARLTVSSEIDERTLREVYLAPFEAAVNAGVWSLMAAYPKLNGEHCTENRWLLTDLLRDEWGFDGLVMSDWGATHHRSRPIVAGMDLEMPGPPLVLGQGLLDAIEAGELTEADLDAPASRVVDMAVRAGRIGDLAADVEQSVDLPEERALAARAASDGMVLLRNEAAEGQAPVLPLDSSALTTVAVLGPNADPGVIQGGGSAQLPAHRVVSPLEGLATAFDQADVRHHPGCLAHRYLPQPASDLWAGDITREVWASSDLSGQPALTRPSSGIYNLTAGGIAELPDPMSWSMRWTADINVATTGTHEFSVFAVGPSRVLVNGELVVNNWDDTDPGDGFFQKSTTERRGSIDLTAGETATVEVEWSRGDDDLLAGLRFGYLAPVDEDAMLDEAVALAASSDVAVVVVGLDAEWETESHDRIMFGLPGRQDELVRRVVAANPRTVVVLNAGGPVDLPWLEDVPAALVAWYPGQEFGTSLAAVLSGDAEPGGRLPVTFPRRLGDAPTALDVPGDGDLLHYREGSMVGYRWYDTRSIEPLVPFGFGLSYATFEVGAATVLADGSEGVSVSVPVTNTSNRPGKAVVQVYVEPPAGRLRRPLRLLGGFAATRLDGGASSTLTIVVPARAFEIYEPGQGWVTPAGEYRLHVATSSRDLLHSVSVER